MPLLPDRHQHLREGGYFNAIAAEIDAGGRRRSAANGNYFGGGHQVPGDGYRYASTATASTST